jgi:8-oxo-dGTP pyrophosphatase MutT (NUDIX family)
MPSKSQAQHKLMEAAAHTVGGYGGVPQSVGKEFIAADTNDAKGAGVIFLTPDDKALFLLRSGNSNNPNMWDLPGGKALNGESAEETACREAAEEIGASPYGELELIDSDDKNFIMFRKLIRHEFIPKLNAKEHTEYRWAALSDAPNPVHPSVAELIKKITQSNKNDKETLSMDGLAFDRASVRTIDQDGRMRVEISHISKAMVCPYLGHEIPYHDDLGLHADKVYMLLRDPDELEKSVDTWNSVPLLNEHVAVSAQDHRPENVVGATGSDAAFNAPYLDNSLVIWEKKAIDGINSGEQQEISCAYYYTPDMTPGTYEGVAYDGVMRNIRANHVALVQKGRAGPDVLVNDSQLNLNGAINMGKKPLSRKAVMAKGALLAVLKPSMMAADSQMDLNQILSGVKRKNWLSKKPGIVAAIKPHLAKDADLDQLMCLLDKLDVHDDDNLGVDDMDDSDDIGMDDEHELILSKLRGKISDEDLAEIAEMLKAKKDMASDEPSQTSNAANADPKNQDNKEPLPAKDEDKEDEDEDDEDKKDKEDKMDKAAMDRAIKIACDATARDAERKTIARMRAIVEAEELVKPLVGKLAAMDSAEDVFKAALTALNVDVSGVHPSAYRTLLKYIPNPNEVHRQPGMASDRSIEPTADIYAQFPDLINQ